MQNLAHNISQKNTNEMQTRQNQHTLIDSEDLYNSYNKGSTGSNNTNDQNATVSVSLTRQKKPNRTIRKAVYLNGDTNEIAEKAMAKYGLSFNELINQLLDGLEDLD